MSAVASPVQVGPRRGLLAAIAGRAAYQASWSLIPRGQNSSYVYMTHLFVVVVLYSVASKPIYVVPLSWGPLDVISLGSQLAALIVAWLMVRTKFLFWLVPR